jgi:aspartate racemase
VSPVDEIVGEVRRRGLRRVAIFGTRFTIESAIFGRLREIEVVIPAADETEFIHQVYLEIVNAGSGTEAQYEGLRKLAHTPLQRENVEAIILAGTELPLIFNETNLDFPHIDGSLLHLDAIMRQLMTPDRGQ